MRYAILGAGAMGSIIGAILAKGGQDVVLVDPYKEHMDKIRNDGLHLTLIQAAETVKLNTCTNPDEAGPADVVVLLVKGFHSTEAVKGASALFRGDTFICSLQNGLGNDELLAKLLPRERILQGVLRMTGSLRGPGDVIANVGAGAAAYIGSISKQTAADEKARLMATHLCAGGIAAEFSPAIAEHVWAKAVINTCVNGTCGIFRVNVKNLFKHPTGMELVVEITREVVAVAAAKGIHLHYDALMSDMIASVALAGEHFPSMAQDIRYKRRTEIESLNGAIVKYGRELGIATPTNEYVARFVKIIEENYAVQY